MDRHLACAYRTAGQVACFQPGPDHNHRRTDQGRRHGERPEPASRLARSRRRDLVPMNEPYAVVGATGGQGGAVVDALLERGREVRALVRRSSSRSDALRLRGVDIAVADITDRGAIASAVEGCAGVFAMTTPFEDGPEAEIAQGAALVGAFSDSGVPHVVFSSVADADKSTGVPHFDTKAATESLLRDSSVSYTIVGPTYFYDNLLGGLDSIRRGRLDLPLPVDTPLQQLSRRDLGRFVALVFDDRPRSRRDNCCSGVSTGRGRSSRPRQHTPRPPSRLS